VTVDLSTLWNEIEKGALVPGITARRFVASAPVDIFVGVESPGATRVLFLEASSTAVGGAGTRWPQSAGIIVEVEPGTRGPGRSRVVIRLRVPGYSDVFSALGADLITTLGPASDESAAVRLFLSRLERWQRLLTNRGAEGLSLLEQRGLFGELVFLRDHLMPLVSPAAALDAWTGPLAKDQDFQLPTCSVECKVSVTGPDQEIHVSNVRQLDETASSNGSLFLFHLSLEERHLQGDSLVTLVEDVRRALASQADRFTDLLADAGYLDVHAVRYSQLGYVIKARRSFHVRDTFPRILERELRNGVGDVRYVIQLGACAPFEVDDSILIELVRGAG
jgi:hypothetical protein